MVENSGKIKIGIGVDVNVSVKKQKTSCMQKIICLKSYVHMLYPSYIHVILNAIKIVRLMIKGINDDRGYIA